MLASRCAALEATTPDHPTAILNSDHTIQCRCGRLQGTLSRDARFTRLSCYCRDCQAYAHALGSPDLILDDLGGTDIVATLQQYVTFAKGTDSLACLSLSERGLLRWYASCCNTPIGNTARDPKLSYVGVVHTCLGASSTSLDAVFGPARMPVNTKHARGKLRSNVLSTLVSAARIIRPVLWARACGTWKRSAFFRSNDFKPVVPPRVLSPAERERARAMPSDRALERTARKSWLCVPHSVSRAAMDKDQKEAAAAALMALKHAKHGSTA
jgi:Family of unknown function (DUF6151)